MHKHQLRPCFAALALAAAAFCAQAAAPAPSATVRISSFDALQDVVGAVFSAVGKPVEGVMGPAIVKAQLSRFGVFDSAAPINLATWIGRGKMRNEDTGIVADLSTIVGAVVEIPVAGAKAEALPMPLDELEKHGVGLAIRDDKVLAVIDVSKITGENGNITFVDKFAPADMLAAAETAFATPARYPEALAEFTQTVPEFAKDSSQLIGLVLSQFPDIPKLAQFRAGIEKLVKSFAADAADVTSAYGCVKFSPEAGFTIVNTDSVKPGSPLAAAIEKFETLEPGAFAGIPASSPAFFASAATHRGNRAASTLREAILPILLGFCEAADDENDDDFFKAGLKAQREGAEPFVEALAKLCEASSGTGCAFLAADGAGRIAIKSKCAVSSPEAATGAFAAARNYGTSIIKALGESFDSDGLSVSPAEETNRLEVTLRSEGVPVALVVGGRLSDDRTAVETLFGTGDLDIAGASPVDPEPLFALAKAEFAPGTRPVCAGAVSLSGVLRTASKAFSVTTGAEPDGVSQFLADIPENTSAKGAVGVADNAFTTVTTIPMSAFQLVANFAAFQAANQFDFGEPLPLDFDGEYEDDDEDGDDD